MKNVDSILLDISESLACLKTNYVQVEKHLDKLNGQITKNTQHRITAAEHQDRINKNSTFRIQGYFAATIFTILILPMFWIFIKNYI